MEHLPRGQRHDVTRSDTLRTLNLQVHRGPTSRNIMVPNDGAVWHAALFKEDTFDRARAGTQRVAVARPLAEVGLPKIPKMLSVKTQAIANSDNFLMRQHFEYMHL